MKNLLFLSLLLTGCAHDAFYVKQNEMMGKVTVNECDKIWFKNIDTGRIVRKKNCKNIVMNSEERAFWKKSRPDEADKIETTSN